MPINPLISLQSRAPNVGESFSHALFNLGRVEDIRRNRAEAPLRNKLLSAQIQGAESDIPTPEAQFSRSQLNKINSIAIGAQEILPSLESGDISSVVSTLQNRAKSLMQANIPVGDTMEAIALAQTNPDLLLTQAKNAVLVGQKTGAFAKVKAQFGGQQTFKDAEGNLFFGTTKRNPNSGKVDSVLAPIGASPDQPIGRVSLVSSLGETAAEQIESASIKSEKTEIAKETTKLKFKPQIEKAVIAARKEAENRGDVFNELNQAKAALPSLKSAVSQLRELSAVATSTFGGKVFDLAVKETGFGSTKGATAKAKFIAVINNQVLPLLKPTFGAAFTVQEGESLKATMGDPDASPEEKMVQLDAFIDQKLRDIETKEAQLGTPAPTEQPAAPEGATATNPETGQKVIFTDGQWQPAS